MTAQHPDLTAAISDANAGALFAIAMRARASARRGDYCECSEPLTEGLDLMCGACLRNNKDQERLAVHRLVEPHPFEPGELGGLMCAVCTNWEESPRHNGRGAEGHTSWGEVIRGADQ